MRPPAGPTFAPALVVLGGAGVVLFFADADWLRLVAALLLLVGVALGVFAVATPEFLAADEDDERA